MSVAREHAEHERRRGNHDVKRVWLWWSSGKDSAWSLHVLRREPDVVVERLVTTVTRRFDRVAIHGTRASVLEAQSVGLEIPLLRIDLPFPCSNAEYEAAVEPVLREARDHGVGLMAFGDLFLEDVRSYREELLDGSGIEPLFPIWGRDTARLAREIVDAGIEAYLTCVDPTSLDARLAGVRYDHAFLDALPRDAAGPMFRRRLEVRIGEVVERSGFVYADVLPEG
jgi:diphthamide synthase (EF-2-diphthine--ammonia ligase)